MNGQAQRLRHHPASLFAVLVRARFCTPSDDFFCSHKASWRYDGVMSSRNPPPPVEEVVTFTVPYLTPPTANHYKKPCLYTGKDGFLHRGFKRGPEADAFYDAVAIFARGRTVSPQSDGERRRVRYGVRIDVYLGPHARMDFDNAWKCGLDALKNAGVIHSDANVDGEESKCVLHKDQRDNPRTEYTVRRVGIQK